MFSKFVIKWKRNNKDDNYVPYFSCRLAVPGQKVKSSELINSKYVTDCVNQNKLLDLENYR